MNRSEHLQWSKDRALKYCDNNDAIGAWTSFASDMAEHEELRNHPVLPFGMKMLMDGTSSDEMKTLIEGFN